MFDNDTGDPGGSFFHDSRPTRPDNGGGGSTGIRSRSNSRGSISEKNFPKRGTRSSHITPIPTNVATNNAFSSLNVDVSEHGVIRTKVTEANESNNSKIRPPPITVFGLGISEITKIITLKFPAAKDITYKLTQFGTQDFS